jgi:hypothetical protein
VPCRYLCYKLRKSDQTLAVLRIGLKLKTFLSQTKKVNPAS